MFSGERCSQTGKVSPAFSVCVCLWCPHTFFPQIGLEWEQRLKRYKNTVQEILQKKTPLTWLFFPISNEITSTSQQQIKRFNQPGLAVKGEDGKLFQLCIWNNKDLLATRVLNLFVLFCFGCVSALTAETGNWVLVQSGIEGLHAHSHTSSTRTNINNKLKFSAPWL